MHIRQHVILKEMKEKLSQMLLTAFGRSFRFRFFFILAAVTVLGYWGGSFVYAAYPIPSITGITPGSVYIGDPTTVYWNGSNFVSGSPGTTITNKDPTGAINPWNSVQYVSSTQLKAAGTITGTPPVGNYETWAVQPDGVTRSNSWGIWVLMHDPNSSTFSSRCQIPGTSGTASWGAVAGAASYRLSVDDWVTGTRLFTDVVVTGTSYTFGTTPGHTYWWWVAAVSSNGVRSANVSPIRTTSDPNGNPYNGAMYCKPNTAPNVPAWSNPPDNVWTNNTLPFRVYATDPDGGTGAIDYFDFTSVVTDVRVPSGTSYQSFGTFSTPTIPPETSGIIWRARAKDSYGAYSGWSAYWTAKVDRTVPSAGSITIKGGAPFTNALSSGNDLIFTCSDALSGCHDMLVSNSGTFSGTHIAIATYPNWSLTSGDGLKTVSARLYDWPGNYLQVSDTITLDTTPPTGSVVINGGAAYTTNPTVSLALLTSDALSGYPAAGGRTEMRFSFDNGVTWEPWTVFPSSSGSAAVTRTLSGGFGTKTVLAQYRDSVLNTSITYQDSIDYASAALSAGINPNPPGGSVPLNGVDLAATATGGVGGTYNYTFYCNRSDSGTNITRGAPWDAGPAWDRKTDSVTSSFLTELDVCNYVSVGSYTAKVIIENGAQAAESRVTITVVQPAPAVSFSPNPAAINPGQSSTLSWTTRDVTSCFIDQGIGSVPVNGSRVVSPAVSTVYTMTCTGPGGNVSAQASVTLSTVPIFEEIKAPD